MTVELISNGLIFRWSEIGNTINIFNHGSGDVVTAANIPDGSSIAYFKKYVKRWLKDNECFKDDGYLLTVISRGYWK